MIITLCRIVYVILILQDDPFIILEQDHFPGRTYSPAVTVFIVIFFVSAVPRRVSYIV